MPSPTIEPATLERGPTSSASKNVVAQLAIVPAFCPSSDVTTCVACAAKGAAIPDEVSCYMLAGQYYLKTEREEKGKEMLMHAKDLAEKGLEADPNNAQFKNMVKHIDSLFSEEEKA